MTIGVILAAGQGTRLMPYTKNKPKCLVNLNHRSLLSYQVETMNACGINKIYVVAGYKSFEIKKFPNLLYVINRKYKKTNMVESLYCLKDKLINLNNDVIISYSDIIYHKSILEKLLNKRSQFSVVIDLNWRQLWELRFKNPLKEAETLKIKRNLIKEIGKKSRAYKEIEGQYIGLIKLKKLYLQFSMNIQILKESNKKDIEKIFLTDFIQYLITKKWNISPVTIKGNWLEVDSKKDLKLYRSLISKKSSNNLSFVNDFF